ncbi:Uncharacterized protein DBV15_03082 [Temnothorax longispinosus]|uniref:Uncharacterized protein n=1 Tax=Temnothorax longispinosus TaxID=300112 RepID=A0A4S2KMW3_9HYME|nr:Uncharacterized protein DBV15_03082 [Temnothorax longispinosus]
MVPLFIDFKDDFNQLFATRRSGVSFDAEKGAVGRDLSTDSQVTRLNASRRYPDVIMSAARIKALEKMHKPDVIHRREPLLKFSQRATALNAFKCSALAGCCTLVKDFASWASMTSPVVQGPREEPTNVGDGRGGVAPNHELPSAAARGWLWLLTELGGPAGQLCASPAVWYSPPRPGRSRPRRRGGVSSGTATISRRESANGEPEHEANVRPVGSRKERTSGDSLRRGVQRRRWCSKDRARSPGVGDDRAETVPRGAARVRTLYVREWNRRERD